MTFESTDTERPVQRMDILDKLTEVGRADAVFSAPVSNGDYVVITASETMVGLGFGFGSGKSNGETGEGGGGGGFGVGRPVAVIVVRADEIEVRPVIDRTKIALTALAALGAVLMMVVKLAPKGR